MPQRSVYLVRHGEVANPNHVVYADLPGFNLSPLGVRQAHAAGRHLATLAIDVVVTSPLARAVQTATAIARHHHLVPRLDAALGETRQYPAWTGQRWEDLDGLFPGQLEAYLEDPTRCEGTAETVEEVAGRMAAAIERTSAGVGHLVVVGHQDPLQAARLTLTGRPLSELLASPPAHASVVTLVDDGGGWVERSAWVAELDPPTAPETGHHAL